MANLQIKNLSLEIGNKTLVSGINGKVNAGELHGLIGPNGAGKSTLLKTILGIHSFSQGDVLLNEESLKNLTPQTRAKSIAVVYSQHPQSIELKASELMELGRLPWKNKNPKLFKEICEILNLNAFLPRKISTLSDGERQRVYIARALLQETPIILLDEPLAHLDVVARVQLLKHLKAWAQAKNCSILLSLHEISLAIDWCDQLLLLDDKNSDWGLPQDLILKHRLQKVFKNGDLQWDSIEAKVIAPTNTKYFYETVNNAKSREHLHWSVHALKKIGWKQISKAPNTLYIEKDFWIWKTPQVQVQFGTLLALKNYLSK